MPDELRTEADRLAELRETAETMDRLAEDAARFRRVVEAFRTQDVARFQAELAAAGLFERCRLICRFLCSKHCVFICLRLCGPAEAPDQLDIDEIREFAQATAQIARDEALLRRLVAAVDTENVEDWRALVAELKLERFCHQLCHWLCFVRCRLVCELFCPPPPLITEVGEIPRDQINAAGYAAGPSIPGVYTPADDLPNGAGDHPFGGLTKINGAFNIAAPYQYRVEFATNPAGPWTAIMQPVQDFDINPSPPPFFVHFPRLPDANGWYTIADMKLGSEGQTYLTDWPTPAAVSDLYYLRLTVRTAALAEYFSPIVPVRIDNTVPTKPVIKLQLKKPDGSLTDLGCCEEVEQGDGNTLVVSLQASDANFSAISVSLLGGCGVSLGLVATDGTALSKSYNGNLADTGYPVLTAFEWDPWASGVDPCCYLIYVQIWDRAIVSNQWGGRHTNVNWHSITIA